MHGCRIRFISYPASFLKANRAELKSCCIIYRKIRLVDVISGVRTAAVTKYVMLFLPAMLFMDVNF